MITDYRTPPEWLVKVAQTDINSQELPLKDILKDSFYYPGAGCDGLPMNFFKGKIFSFIYVDHMAQNKNELEMFRNHMDPGFLFERRFSFNDEFSLLGAREVKSEEFLSSFWYPQKIETTKQVFGEHYPRHNSTGNFKELKKEQHAVWCIIEVDFRTVNERFYHFFSSDYFPRKSLVSLLYIFDEGVKMYDALYYQNKMHPAVLALIQTFGFSSNWTNFANEKDIMGQMTMNNPYGAPEYLMYGGWGKHTKDNPGGYGNPVWESYSEYIDAAEGHVYGIPDRYAGLWEKTI